MREMVIAYLVVFNRAHTRRLNTVHRCGTLSAGKISVCVCILCGVWADKLVRARDRCWDRVRGHQRAHARSARKRARHEHNQTDHAFFGATCVWVLCGVVLFFLFSVQLMSTRSGNIYYRLVDAMCTY